MNNHKPLCVAPWESIFLAENRHRPCCRIISGSYSSPPETVEELMNIVNSPFLRQLRRRLTSGDVAGTVCENCIYSGLNESELHDYSHIADEHIKGLIEKTKEAIRTGQEVLDFPPIHLVFSFPGVCNIQCKMCTVHSSARRGKPRTGNIFTNSARNLLEAVGGNNIAMLSVGGGEPLFNKTTLEFMDYAADHIHPETVLSTGTNGKTLHKHIDLLRRFQNIFLNVSIDGHGEAYEQIRVGVAWDHILSNLRLLSEEARQHPGWRITTRTVLMRTTIPSIPNLVELLTDLGFEPEFTPIFGDFYDENVYMFTGLLSDMDWRGHFEKGVLAAQKAGDHALAKHLQHRLKELQLQVSEGKNTYYRSYPLRMERLLQWMNTRYKDEKIVLLGLTEEVGYFLYYYLSIKAEFDIAGICLLEDVPDAVTDVLGIPLIAPDELSRWKGKVLISCYTRDYQRYLEFAQKNVDADNIDTLSFEVVDANTDEVLLAVGQRPVVLFGTGGCSRLLVSSTSIKDANIVAFSDNDQSKWGTEFCGKPVIPPSDITSFGRDVVICSRAYQFDIQQSLTQMHGESVSIHLLYP